MPENGQPTEPDRPDNVALVDVQQLMPGPGVRLKGEDEDHARLLAQTADTLPPILVHRRTMAVVDGMHRLLAASMRGESKVLVQFFDGTESEALVAAVKANISHGKPLTLGDRECAAERILDAYPEWSNRAVASTCGLSPKTVAALRRRATGETPRSRGRVGQDGRIRPTNPADGRLRAAAALTAQPKESLRGVAQSVGTSVSTVRDVRRRLAEGRDPVPERYQRPAPPDAAGDQAWRRPDATTGYRPTQDPAFDASPEAEEFARWFEGHALEPVDWEPLLDAVPLSRVYLVCDEARRRAEGWRALSDALERRLRG